MLPIFTTGQVKDGVDTGDLLIDLSEYMKKKEGATKTELDTLTTIVANKLDAEPQHKHHIDDIKQLETALASKYDTSQRYSYNVILSDSEKIPYLEAPKVGVLEVVKNLDAEGYKFYVDDGSGDLMIVFNDVLIGTYAKSTGNWVLSGVNLGETLENHYEALDAVCNATLVNIGSINNNAAKITSLESMINEYITKTDAVIRNHYDALKILCTEHGIIDGDTGDGDHITPTGEGA